MPSVYRILDANANRAREALRVMEEAARFLLDDADLTSALKQLRHDVSAALREYTSLELHRDTPADVGTTIATDAERHRASAVEVAIAAGKRLGEALRAIEEYGKTIDTQLATALEAARYRGYELERRLLSALGSGLARQWSVCVIISEALCRDGDWLEVARAALEGGADCIQLREKDLPDDELLRRSRQLVELRPRSAAVIINDRPDIALLSGADGVHLGQDDLSCADARRLAGRQLIIGVSTSNLDEAKQALADGADYCGVGPMFRSTTKHKDTIVGPAYLRSYLEWNGLPHLAIGGITPYNLSDLVNAGVWGIAVSSAVCGANDPAAVVRELAGVLQKHPAQCKQQR